jgi:hypothetical protein
VIGRQLGLKRIGLDPGTPLETIARSTVSLVSDGFYDKVASGQLGSSAMPRSSFSRPDARRCPTAATCPPIW